MFAWIITALLALIVVVWLAHAGVALILGGILRGIFGDSMDSPTKRK